MRHALLVGLSLSLPVESLRATSNHELRGRRRFISSAFAIGIQTTALSQPCAAELNFATSSSGLQWADAKVGAGSPPQNGDPVVIDYVMSTTGAARGAKLDSTTDRQMPYRWVLGDGSTIRGVEQAVAGGDGVPPMLPGGVRRVIIASSPLGFNARECEEGRGPGPTPPPDEAFGTYQRFKNVFCNANRPYQPELVFDVKLLPPGPGPIP